MNDHNYDLAAFHEACNDEDVADIQIAEQIPKGRKINLAHTPVKSPHHKKQKKGNQNPLDDSV